MGKCVSRPCDLLQAARTERRCLNCLLIGDFFRLKRSPRLAAAAAAAETN